MPRLPTSTASITAVIPANARALPLVQGELLALAPAALVRVNVDVTSAALVVLGAAPHIRLHREALVALVGEEMTSAVDRLELVAQAALEAQAVHQAVVTGVEVQVLSEELLRTRAMLLADVRALIARGVVPAGAIAQLNRPHGFANQCVDVLQLVAILKSNWEVIEPQVGIDLAFVDRAEATANALAKALGAREHPMRAPSAELRQRAFTLLTKTYDRVRRIVSFLRWEEGDADRIAPSFFRGRSNGRRNASGEPSTSPRPPKHRGGGRADERSTDEEKPPT